MLSGTLTLLIFNPVFIPKYSFAFNYCAVCLVAQSCPTLCNLMDSSPPGSSVYGDSPGKNIGVGCHALLQGIFPAQISCIAGGFFTMWAARKTLTIVASDNFLKVNIFPLYSVAKIFDDRKITAFVYMSCLSWWIVNYWRNDANGV